MSEWISVEDRLPLEPDRSITFESVEVLACDDLGHVSTAEFARGGGHVGQTWACWSDYSHIKPGRITHWMPLPEPPK